MVCESSLAIDFSPVMEPFNGNLKDKCLSASWFLSIDDARRKIEVWKNDCNGFREHPLLGYLIPDQFLVNTSEA